MIEISLSFARVSREKKFFTLLKIVVYTISRGRNMDMDSKMQLYNDFGQYVFISRAWTKVRRNNRDQQLMEKCENPGFVKRFYNLGFKIVCLKSENRFRQAR